MRYKRAAVALSVGIFLAGVLAGCKSSPPPLETDPSETDRLVEAPFPQSGLPTSNPETAQRVGAPLPPSGFPGSYPETARGAGAPLSPSGFPRSYPKTGGMDGEPFPDFAPAAPQRIPARPLNRDILELIEKSSYQTRDLQYFISSTVTLERGKGMQIDIALDPSGQGVIQETNAREKIIIPRDTGGVLVPEPGVPGGPRTLKICFEERDDHALTFRENPSDHRYYLVFQEDRQYGEFTEYGNESYRVTFDGEIPYLYVKLDERTDDQPRVRQVQGRYVSPGYSDEAAPVAVQETVEPGRSPRTAAPEPAPQAPAAQPVPAPPAPPPPAEAAEEELNLEALPGF